MGIDFKIGKRIWIEEPEYDEGGYYWIEEAHDPNAPKIPGAFVSKDSNMSSCSYTGFSSFLKRLYDVDEDLAEFLDVFTETHPDMIRLRDDHGQAFNRARKKFEQMHPGLAPAYCTCGLVADKDCKCGCTTESADLARLVWFEHWTIMALETIPEAYLHNF